MASLLVLALPAVACDLGGGDGSADTDAATDGDTEDGDGDGDSGANGTATETGVTGGDGGDDDGGGNDDGGGDDTGADPPPPADYALGRVVLSESHVEGSGSASGSVSAAFIPDAAIATGTCTEQVAGCEIAVLPDCPAGCGDGEYCGFADGCESACLDICDASCDDDEVCYFAAPGQAACREREDFDAGSLSFSGTTTPITLFPPYVANGFDTGAPYLPSSDVSISASGATGAGFEAFDASFGTTTLMNSSLDDVTVSQAYGSGPMPVQWQAGTDDVVVSVTVSALDGSYGTITCDADDANGGFDVPREAIEAAVGGQDAAAVSVSLTRRRVEVVDGLTTTGELLFAEVQSDGRLELITSSTASATIEGCGFAELLCDDECTDVEFDQDHCGGCNQPCEGLCEYGECLTEDNNDACSDGWDNDDDGFTDCEDFSCSMNPAVTVCGSPENTDAACDDGIDNDDDGYYDCEDFDCDGTAPCEGGGEEGGGEEGGGEEGGDPGEWTCNMAYYDAADGCDCGCGIPDPDCTSNTADVCDYCAEAGSCASSCGDIDPNDNSQCV
ncbi:MAG: hypothetical protein AAGA54_28170 [Myxococcota bacterium]